MRLFELVTLNDVLNSPNYQQLVNGLSIIGRSDPNVMKIKNRIINSWLKGMKSRKHYDSLLNQIDLSLNDLIDK
jgi:hypothetical protein